MMCRKFIYFVCVLVLFVVAKNASAVTFINANTTNTVGWDNSTDWWVDSGYSADDRWHHSTGFGMAEGESLPATPTGIVSGGEIYQSISSGQSGKDARTLKTTITGLDSSETYNIYVYFWSDQAGSPWTIRAALTQVGLADLTYSPYTGNATQVGLDSSNRILWEAKLGYVTGVTEQVVWIDDLPTNDSNVRTWYDGVGYQIPEPVTVALLGLGGLALIRRKR
jgi:hypothetical protein